MLKILIFLKEKKYLDSFISYNLRELEAKGKLQVLGR